MISGYVGWRRRLVRREETGQETYRSAASSLPTRARKKLTGKEDWYRKTEKRKRDYYDSEEFTGIKRIWRDVEKKEDEKEVKTVAVMFVPYTKESELARQLRQAECELGAQTGVEIKIVERAGVKLVDMLHKADPWKGMDCGREQCFLCSTKQKTGKRKEQDCTKRSIVYENWCITCEKREMQRVEDMKLEEEEKK